MKLTDLLRRPGPLWSAADTNAGAGGDTGNPPPPGGDQSGGDGGAGGTAPDFSWFAQDPSAEERRTLEAKGFKSPRDLFKSMRAAESAVRGDHIPGPPDNPDERSAWFKEQVAPRLGVPDTPEGYELGKPEFDESVAPYVRFDDERHSRFLGKAHELGLSPDQAAGILDLYREEMGSDVQAHMEQAQADQTEMEAALKKDWGRDYDQNMRAAVETAKEFGIDEAQAEALRAGNVMGSAALAKAMHELAQLRGDDGLKGGARAGQPGTSPQEAQKRLDEFTAKNGEALTKGDHPQHAWAMDELQRLKAAAGRGSQAR